MEFTARVAPQRLRNALFVMAAALVAASLAVALIVDSFPPQRVGRSGRLGLRLLQNFNAGIERSVPTAFTLLLLLLCASVLGLIAVLHRRRRLDWVRHWQVLSVLFLFFAADEFLGLHEQVAVPIRTMVRTRAGGLFYFAWVLPALVFVAAVALAMRRFFAELPPATRRDFLLGAALFVGGAVGMEMVGGMRVAALGVTASEARNDLLYVALTSLRQGIEMVGVALFLTAAMDYLLARAATLRLNVHAASATVPQPITPGRAETGHRPDLTGAPTTIRGRR